MYAERIKGINESPTAKIFAKAVQMKRENLPIIDLSIGEPDFPTPDKVKEAAKKAINNNFTKYTVNSGIIELRQAIARKLKLDNNLEYDLNQIIVTNGAKQAVFNTIMTLVEKGDEVIIPAPYWVSYPEMVTIAEATPLIIQTDENTEFKLSPEQLNKAITKKTKVLILCNPSNPTGVVYTISELEQIAEILRGKEIFVIADEIYEKLVYDNLRFTSIAALSPEMKKQTIVINGLSKAYAMPGWRIGYAAGDREIIDGLLKLQGHTTGNASSISQYASLAAFNGSQGEVNTMREEYQKRRDFMFDQLEQIKDISCQKPKGAFYVFPNISAFFNKVYKDYKLSNSEGFANFLLDEAKVVVIPGSAFGSDNYIRISYTSSMQNLQEGMKRIKKALEKISV